ncbi:hypothetical protein LINPERHAP2_LOCUS24017 [Linum perenne]
MFAREEIPRNISPAMLMKICGFNYVIIGKKWVQEICEQNKINRSCLSKPHNQGSVAFIPLFHETHEKEGSENFDWIEFFKRTRMNKSGDWMTPQCEEAYVSYYCTSFCSTV